MKVGDRIEIPVHYDMWMRGARFGVVTARRNGGDGTSGYFLLKLDRTPAGRRLKLWDHDVPYAKIISKDAQP